MRVGAVCARPPVFEISTRADVGDRRADAPRRGDLAMKILLSTTSRREALAAGAAFLLAVVPSPPPALAVGEELAALAPAPVIGSRIDLLLRPRCVRCRAGRWT